MTWMLQQSRGYTGHTRPFHLQVRTCTTVSFGAFLKRYNFHWARGGKCPTHPFGPPLYYCFRLIFSLMPLWTVSSYSPATIIQMREDGVQCNNENEWCSRCFMNFLCPVWWRLLALGVAWSEYLQILLSARIRTCTTTACCLDKNRL